MSELDPGVAQPAAAFTVRSATPDDEPAMLEIQQSSAVHHATIDPDRWRAPSLEAAGRSRRRWHAIGPRDEGIVAVADDGSVVGMVELWLKRPQGSGQRADSAVACRPRTGGGAVLAWPWRGHGPDAGRRGLGSQTRRASE